MMFELHPLKGIGAVPFGASPDEVKRELGADLVWEEWMGGNLNDSLYFRGIVFGFDLHDARGPLATARLRSIVVNASFPAVLFDTPLHALHRDNVLRALKARSAHVRTYPNGSVEAAALRLHCWFDADGSVSELLIAADTT